MARFSAATARKAAPPDTVNRAGGQAYALDPRVALATQVLTSTVQAQFYAKEGDQLAQLSRLAEGCAPEYVARCAIYARREFHLRTVSHVLAAHLAVRARGAAWLRPLLASLIERPDDTCELVAACRVLNGKAAVPNALKRACAKALLRFDAYQIAKYKGGSRDVSLVDVVNLCHPKGGDGPIGQLVKGTLPAPATWEAKLSAAGQVAAETEDREEAKAEAKAQVWAELLASRKLGYFAALRNARNILSQAPDQVPALCALLIDPKLIAKSKVFPTQLHTAAKAVMEAGGVEGAAAVMAALADAVELALANVPVLAGRTAIVIDESGSMMPKPFDVAVFLAAVLFKTQPDADVLLFAGAARWVAPNRRDSVLTIAATIAKGASGGSTDFHAIFPHLRASYARVMVLSDMQGWVDGGTVGTTVAEYEKRTGAKPFVYGWDLNGHGTSQFPADRVITLAGWSDKVFDLIPLAETDRMALVSRIESLPLPGV